MLALPDGYSIANGKRAQHWMLGDDWSIIVLYRGQYAFELSKLHGPSDSAPRFFGRMSVGMQWQQYPHYTDAAKILVAKHKILGGMNGS